MTSYMYFQNCTPRIALTSIPTIVPTKAATLAGVAYEYPAVAVSEALPMKGQCAESRFRGGGFSLRYM